MSSREYESIKRRRIVLPEAMKREKYKAIEPCHMAPLIPPIADEDLRSFTVPPLAAWPPPALYHPSEVALYERGYSDALYVNDLNGIPPPPLRPACRSSRRVTLPPAMRKLRGHRVPNKVQAIGAVDDLHLKVDQRPVPSEDVHSSGITSIDQRNSNGSDSQVNKNPLKLPSTIPQHNVPIINIKRDCSASLRDHVAVDQHVMTQPLILNEQKGFPLQCDRNSVQRSDDDECQGCRSAVSPLTIPSAVQDIADICNLHGAHFLQPLSSLPYYSAKKNGNSRATGRCRVCNSNASYYCLQCSRVSGSMDADKDSLAVFCNPFTSTQKYCYFQHLKQL